MIIGNIFGKRIDSILRIFRNPPGHAPREIDIVKGL